MPRKVRCEKTFVAEDKSIKTPSKKYRTRKDGITETELFTQLSCCLLRHSNVSGAFYIKPSFAHRRMGKRPFQEASKLFLHQAKSHRKHFGAGIKSTGLAYFKTKRAQQVEQGISKEISTRIPLSKLKAEDKETLRLLLELGEQSTNQADRTATLLYVKTALELGFLPIDRIKEDRNGTPRSILVLSREMRAIIHRGKFQYDVENCFPSLLYLDDLKHGIVSKPLEAYYNDPEQVRRIIVAESSSGIKDTKKSKHLILSKLFKGRSSYFNSKTFEALNISIQASGKRFTERRLNANGNWTTSQNITILRDELPATNKQGSLLARLLLGELGLCLNRAIKSGINIERLDTDALISTSGDLELSKYYPGLKWKKSVIEVPSCVFSLPPMEQIFSTEKDQTKMVDVKTPPVIPKPKWMTPEYQAEREKTERNKALLYAKASPDKRKEVGL